MERWQLSTKEVVRYSVIENAIKGYLKASQAAEQFHLSTRQVFRLKKALRKEGIVGLIHGNKGRASPHRISEEVRDKVDFLYRGKYTGFNLSHFTEMLEEKETLGLSRETVRLILLEKGSYEKKKRQPKHRSWREPLPKVGIILHMIPLIMTGWKEEVLRSRS